MRISIIVAIDAKNGIGKNNDLLFKIPEDYQRMKKIIFGHPLVMGRKTFESIGRVLPENTSIIITKNAGFQFPDFVKTEEEKTKCMIVHSLEEGIEKAKTVPGSDNIVIFGGGQIFKEALEKNLIDRLYLTIVEGDFGADTLFPDYSEFKKIIFEEDHDSGGYKFKFLDLEK
jgi:dihydrofolate reductase